VSLSLEILPADVKRLLDEKSPLVLIDVREPFEAAIAQIEGSELIPMNTVPAALPVLEGKADEATLIVYCHHGVRSLSVVNWLRQQGVEKVQSMTGGIDLWSRQIDPKIPRY
jgi:rhodanese-related sulfurtransferase